MGLTRIRAQVMTTDPCSHCLQELLVEEHRPSAMLSLTAAGVGLWDWEPRDGAMRCCGRARSICGLTADEPVTFATFLARIHPEDRARVAGTLRQALLLGGQRTIECRTLQSEGERWIEMEGRRCSLSGAVPAVAGVVRDITASKRQSLQRDVLIRELAHRINNVFAVISATVHMSSRSASTPEELTRELQSRIGALARSYTVPDTDGVALQSIVERELAPYSDFARIVMSGEPAWLEQSTAMSMTLILHELATNAMKHGALRSADGELSVRWWSRRDEHAPCVVLHWKEHSSERIESPRHDGLGASLMSMAARNVDGHICMEFQPDGLAATVVLPASVSLD